MVDRSVLNELRTLPAGLGESVAMRLAAAMSAMSEGDPEAALAQAKVASRMAGRVAAVREAVAIAAYDSGRFAEALAELRAVRRMTGSAAWIPMMADCERGLGRPRKALELAASVDADRVDEATKVELLLVVSGARADLGQLEASALALQVPELTRLAPGTPRARLQYAYAEALVRLGRIDEAREWMERAAGSDIEGATDAEERAAELERA